MERKMNCKNCQKILEENKVECNGDFFCDNICRRSYLLKGAKHRLEESKETVIDDVFKEESSDSSQHCSVHGENLSKWKCEKCGAFLCKECKPVAFGGHVYCNKCSGSVSPQKDNRDFDELETNFILRSWKGKEELWIVFWLYTLPLNVLFLFVAFLSGIFLRLLSVPMVMVLVIINIIIMPPIFIWTVVANLRCAFNVKNKFWGYFILIILSIFVLSKINAIRNKEWPFPFNVTESSINYKRNLYKSNSLEKSIIDGNKFLRQKKYRLAIKAYEQALELGPSKQRSLQIYLSLGILYLEIKKDEKAIKMFNEFMDNGGKMTPQIYQHLALAYKNVKKYDLALETINKSMEEGGVAKVSYLLRGDIYQILKKFDLAEADYKKIISFDQHEAHAYRALTKLYIENGQYDDAFETISLLEKNVKNDNFKYYFRGQIYEKTGKYDLALEEYWKAKQKMPKNKVMQEAVNRIEEKLLRK